MNTNVFDFGPGFNPTPSLVQSLMSAYGRRSAANWHIDVWHVHGRIEIPEGEDDIYTKTTISPNW